MIFERIYKNKRVLITGHTGFKGSWLALWLNHLGAKVSGVSNEIPTEPSNFMVSDVISKVDDFRFDISDKLKVVEAIKAIQPDFIFNLAAQPLVIKSYNDPYQTVLTNAIGSMNILDAVRLLGKKVNCIMITSDKVYNNKETEIGYVESDEIGGKDPYSASKGMAELVIKTYVNSFFINSDSMINVGVARAGNVIGGGDWADDRIIPDCIRSWSKKESVTIRNPNSTRPWQHVLEPLSGYLTLGSFLEEGKIKNGEAFNFGPPKNYNYSVLELITEMQNYLGKYKINILDRKNKEFSEAGLLRLNCEKANKHLEWFPTLKFDEMVKMTSEWYKFFHSGNSVNMQDYSLEQIDNYTYFAKKRGIFWSKHD